MKFIQTTGWNQGTKALADRLIKELKSNQRVLWLLTGGSNIAASVKAMATIPDELTKNLAIFMTDERFGDIGHVHSNAKQLIDGGFQQKQAIFVPVLSPGFTMEETQERYAQALERAFEHADVSIAQFGIGPDGHIAGILPHSPAVDETDTLIFAYQTPQYARVTMTFPAIRRVNVAFALVYGEDRKPALTRLHDEELSLEEQPSQVLKALPEAYVYNDQIGDTK